MVECDLVTIFSTQGQILGYNIHVPNTGGRSGVAGGARTRAFLALKDFKFVQAAFMCSQDGQTKIYPENAQA
jgi:hypothetical protein